MQEKNNIYRIIIAAVVLVSLTAGIVSAAPSTESISYQGKLTDSAGTPLTGTYSVTFRLYDTASGGTALATDTHSVQAADGLFTTEITFDPSLFDGRGLWLGISVDSDSEMTPRQEIRPVPYALNVLGTSPDPVLSIVQDIQTSVSSILTSVTVLQTDVTTIKSGMGKPAKPIRYEYYTAPMFIPGGTPGTFVVDSNVVTNAGDSPAEVCWYKYFREETPDFILRNSNCVILGAGKTTILNPTTVFSSSSQERIKITTNSSYVIPTASVRVDTADDEYTEIYYPGDFQKIEIYE